MSAPKNRKSRLVQPAVVPAVVTAAPFELTQDEKFIVMAYRATREDRQHIFLGVAEDFARIYARYKRPALRLVGGGAA
ncbi:hypothetical protein [Massilia antarctica]|uniref:hypothetical protein n=1 Tax=Massilia antarctica TaxID=2765360 RepID=UPI0022710B03|nr:hypothetical protein [Massilia sp. H27-R4]MCY0913223.1 hypothetical protein [Massilia sp. H27-R4]